MTAQTEVATTSNEEGEEDLAARRDRLQKMSIKDMLNDRSVIADIGRALPRHCTPERMARVAITALTRSPDLAKCTKGSFFRCLLDLSQWGLEPDGRRAHLIPYKKNKGKKNEITECQLIIDYKGYVELVYRSGFVKKIHADLVRTGDVFEYSSGEVTKHVPWFLRVDKDKPKAQGEVYAVYCIVEMEGGINKCEVMSVDEVELIKARSSGWQAYKAGYIKATPWSTDWGEMAKKTVFKRASKWLPLSADLRDAMDRDADKIVDSTSTHISSSEENVAGHLGSIMGGLIGEEEASQEGPEDNGNQDTETTTAPSTGPAKTLGEVADKAKAKVADTKKEPEAKKEEPKPQVVPEGITGTKEPVVVQGELIPAPAKNGAPPEVPDELVAFSNEIGAAQTIEKLNEIWDATFMSPSAPEQPQEIMDKAQEIFDFHDRRIIAKVTAAAASTSAPVSKAAEEYIARFARSKTKAGVERIMADGKVQFTAPADLAAIAAAGAARMGEVVAKS